MKPILLGYQAVHTDTSAYELRAGRRELAAFAQREGFALVDVILEPDLTLEPDVLLSTDPALLPAALATVIASAQSTGAEVIAVPSPEDLGSRPELQQQTRRRLEREAGVRVLIVHQPAAQALGA